MLGEQGMSGKFSDVLENNDFFPESFFYQIIGDPENIILYDQKIDTLIKKYKL